MKAIHFAFFFILCLLIYGRGLDIAYYSDDFQFVFETPAEQLLAQFTQANPNNDFYRPIQASVMALIQLFFGLDTRALHLLQILLHSLLCFAVSAYAFFLLGSRPAALIAGVFVAANQAIVAGVLSNDTLAQQTGTLFGFLSVYALQRYLRQPRAKYLVASLLALLLSLFSKETSACFPLIIAALVINEALQNGSLLARVKQALLLAIPFSMVGGFYLLSRSQVVISKAQFGAERYNFFFGSNIIQNVALLGGTPFIPHSSVSTFVAVTTQNWGLLAIVGSATLLSCLIVLGGLYQSKKAQLFIFLTVATILSAFPALLLNHVSEVYCYNLLPFIALLVGLSYGGWQGSKHLKYKAALASALALFLVAQTVAIQGKISQMADCGQRATQALEKLTPIVQGLPQGQKVLLLGQKDTLPAYSVFLIPDLFVLRFGTHMVSRQANRPDISVKLVPFKNRAQHPCGQGCTALLFEGDQIVEFIN